MKYSLGAPIKYPLCVSMGQLNYLGYLLDVQGGQL